MIKNKNFKDQMYSPNKDTLPICYTSPLIGQLKRYLGKKTTNKQT